VGIEKGQASIGPATSKLRPGPPAVALHQPRRRPIVQPNQRLIRTPSARPAAAPTVARRPHPAHDPFMRAVVTSNDPVRLSFLTALLADAGIAAFLLDGHTSVLEGSAGAIQRRLVVSAGDFEHARRLLRDAGEW
jgi:hypothetical protein